MPRILFFERKTMNDRVPDLTGADVSDRDRRVGRSFLNAKVVRFILRPRRDSGEPTDFPTIAFRSVVEVDECAD
jgi:hypothetical protein